jgi:hypothetical protein
VADFEVNRLPVGGRVEVSEYETGADSDPIEKEEILRHLEPSSNITPGSEGLVGAGGDRRYRLWRVGEWLLVPAITQCGAVELE